MNIEKHIERAVKRINEAFGPVEVWVNGGGLIVNPKERMYFGRMVGVYDARQSTFSETEFARDVFLTMGGR